MERAEAEAIYDAGREAVVEVLLAMDRRIKQLEARVEKLERRLAKSSGTRLARRALILRGEHLGAGRTVRGAILAGS